MLEAIASDPTQKRAGKSILSRGYGDTSIPDLMVDYRLGEDRPFTWICHNFILKEEMGQPAYAGEWVSLTRRVLQHALASV